MDISEIVTTKYVGVASIGSRRMAKDKNGVLYYVFIDDYYLEIEDELIPHVRLAISSDNGETWVCEWVSHIEEPCAWTEEPQVGIAIDSNDNLHIVWTGYDYSFDPLWNLPYNAIFYRKRTPVSWEAIELIAYKSTSTTYDNYSPSIAVDRDDNIHVVFTAWQDSPYTVVCYRAKIAGAWSDIENLQTEEGSVGRQWNPSIAIDLNNDIYVFFVGYNTEYYLNGVVGYRKKTGFSWSATNKIMADSIKDEVSYDLCTNSSWADDVISIAVDKDNKICIVYPATHHTGVYCLRYRDSSDWNVYEDIWVSLDIYDEAHFSDITIDWNKKIPFVLFWQWHRIDRIGHVWLTYKKNNKWVDFIEVSSRGGDTSTSLLFATYPVINGKHTNIPDKIIQGAFGSCHLYDYGWSFKYNFFSYPYGGELYFKGFTSKIVENIQHFPGGKIRKEMI